MDKILVGVDDSLAAGAAVRWAARLAESHGAEVLLVNVWLAPDEVDPGPERDAELRERRDRLERLWVREAENLGARVRREVFVGDPRQVLLDVADAEQVDLVVMARSGDSGEEPGTFHLGSVVEYVAHALDRPLAVVPLSAAPSEPGRVLLAVDGSPASSAAVDWCGDALAPLRAEVVALHVADGSTARAPADLPDDWTHFLEESQIPLWTEPVTAHGVTVEPVAVRADRPGPVVLETADDRHCDLVVVGTRGLGGFAGLRVGGTALKVLHRADRPVVLVPVAIP